MKKIFATTVLAAAAAATVAMAPAAAADVDDIQVCSYGVGVAHGQTSCPFAQNVRYAYYHQPGNVVTAYSPGFNSYYVMDCEPAQVTTADGAFYPYAHRCTGGNDAVVFFW